MFDNPFLEGAASSRNKRQQLDHLLRITAPHERIILAGIGVVLLALMAWALFGSIVRSVTIDGVLIEPGLRHEVVSTEPGYLGGISGRSWRPRRGRGSDRPAKRAGVGTRDSSSARPGRDAGDGDRHLRGPQAFLGPSGAKRPPRTRTPPDPVPSCTRLKRRILWIPGKRAPSEHRARNARWQGQP